MQLRIASLIVSQPCRYQHCESIEIHPSATPSFVALLFLRHRHLFYWLLFGQPLQKPVLESPRRAVIPARRRPNDPARAPVGRISYHWLHWLGTNALTRLCVAALFFFFGWRENWMQGRR